MSKNLILVSPKFSESIGGMETHGIEFVNYFYNHDRVNLKAVLVNSNIQDGVKIKNYVESSDYKNIVKRILTGNYEIDAKSIMEQIENEDDILFLNSPTWLLVLPELKKKYSQLHVILRSGGNDIIAGWIGDETDTSTSLEESREILVSLINTYVDTLILNSEYTKKRCLDVGVKELKTIVLKGGVNTESFFPRSLPNQRKKILTTGRFVQFKGMEFSLKAITVLKQRIGSTFDYILVGDGPCKKQLKKMISELDISDVVTLCDAIEFSRIHDYYINSDLFLHLPVEFEKEERNSSYIHTETMGRSICEALSAGLPVVSTKVGGVPEIVTDGINGFLVNSKNYLEAADKLYCLLNNDTLTGKMSQNARKVAKEKYDWKVIFQKYEQIFNI